MRTLTIMPSKYYNNISKAVFTVCVASPEQLLHSPMRTMTCFICILTPSVAHKSVFVTVETLSCYVNVILCNVYQNKTDFKKIYRRHFTVFNSVGLCWTFFLYTGSILSITWKCLRIWQILRLIHFICNKQHKQSKQLYSKLNVFDLTSLFFPDYKRQIWVWASSYNVCTPNAQFTCRLFFTSLVQIKT